MTRPAFDTEPKSKGLTDEHKRLHWEKYALKTEREELLFEKVFDNFFEEQKELVVKEYERTGKLLELNDNSTAKKFEPVIQEVYHDAFENAVPSKTVKQLDEFAREWILARSFKLATEINLTTLEALRNELALGFEAGESIPQISKRLEGYFTDNAKMRATRVARTEVISASNEGALHRYEIAGIDKSEFYPSPDACEECLPLAGEYQTREVHNMIPVHPNCRCTFLPVV
jgi:SPP1 gp7 family putative phage head morphogenesis protein